MTYDPEARHNTPLAQKLKARIRGDGPILVADYMQACLYDPEHGYYTTRAAIGRAGDFITAPEISQVFGELIGLWCAVVWQQMGQPSPFNLVELGPGRGTLMRDALRAARIVPGFIGASRIVLVECSPGLRAQQRQVLNGSTIEWCDSPSGIPDGPAIIVANEFLDCMPADLIVASHYREVGIDADDRLVFLDGAAGEILTCQSDGAFRDAIGNPGRDLRAGLYLDYGHVTRQFGNTLQAVRDHAFEHPLTSPGAADVSVQVDFDAICTVVRAHGLAVDGPLTQGEFLGALGIMQRASRLMAANPAMANEIEMGVARLMAPDAMGTRFKAIGIRSPGLPPLPGFPAMDNGWQAP